MGYLLRIFTVQLDGQTTKPNLTKNFDLNVYKTELNHLFGLNQTTNIRFNLALLYINSSISFGFNFQIQNWTEPKFFISL